MQCSDLVPPLEHLRKAPRAGGPPATAVARLGRSPLRRASLFRQIVKHPGDDYRTFLSFDSSVADLALGTEPAKRHVRSSFRLPLGVRETLLRSLIPEKGLACFDLTAQLARVLVVAATAQALSSQCR
jgi:hypothetical protein